MADWAFHVFDMASGVSLGTLPLASWTHEDRLNDSGNWSATLAAPGSIELARAALAATTAGKSLVVAVRTDDRDVARAEFAGWLPPGGNKRPNLAGANLLSYLDSRVIEVLAAYNSVDQTMLVADLITTKTTGTGIDTGTVAASGRLRDQTWQAWEFKNVGEAIRQIAARIDGFDFDVRVEFEAGSFVRRLRTWYPRRGTPNGPVFEYGVNGNVRTVPEVEGNPDFATRVVAQGEENATTGVRLSSTATNTALTALGYPIIVHREDRSDIKVQQSLDDHAAGVLAQRSNQTDDEIVFEVNPDDATWMWGTWDLGDDCQLIIPAGELEWWPDGLDEKRRIVAHRWKWDVGVETLEVVTGRRLS